MNGQLSLDLEKMTVSEKLSALDLIWMDLRRTADKLPVPERHRLILDSRRQAFEKGEIGYTDWETAKKEIRNRVL